LHDKSIFINRIFESIFAEVWPTPNKRIIVASVYRPNVNHPTLSSSEQFSQFSEYLLNILSDFSASNTQVILFGDFNLDALKYNINNQVTEYIDLLFSFGYLQIVMKPTRCTTHSATLIDHIVTNSKSDVFDTVLLTSEISDHFPVIHFSKSKSKSTLNTTSHYRDFSSHNLKLFSDSFRNINWNFLSTFEETQDCYDSFSETFSSLYDLYFPLTSKKMNKNHHSFNPWMTKGLLVSRCHKIFLFSQSVKFPFEPNISNFKNFRNLYSKTLKASKKLYFQSELFKHQSDSKKTWEILRKAINNKSKKDNSIQNIISDGIYIDDPALMADKFNTFFSNVAQNKVDEIAPLTLFHLLYLFRRMPLLSAFPLILLLVLKFLILLNS